MVNSKKIYNWYISLVAAMCMVLYGYDAAVFNACQGSPEWLAWFNLDTKKDSYLLGLVMTAYTIGAIVSGFLFAGPLADYFGRKVGMMTGCFITIIATFVQTFAPYHDLGAFIGGRVLIGIGQGLALTAGSIYIGEVSPPHIRGRVMTLWQTFYSVGAFIAYWIAYAASIYSKRLGEWGWRIVVIFQILVPFIIIVLLPFQPESPRWWIQRHNNIDKARAALSRIRDTEQEVEDEVLAIREAIEYEKEAISSSYTALFKDPSIRKRLGLCIALNVGQQLTGQGTLNSYSSTIYKGVFTSSNTINLINALNATFAILFTLNGLWTTDRLGRRWLFIVGAIGMAVCMLAVPIVGQKTPNIVGADGTTTKTESVGIAIVFLLFLFIFFYKPSWGATTWIYTTEIFSINVRAQAVGMCSQSQNVANAIFQQFFPTFLANTGFKSLYFFFAVNVLLAVFVYFLIPETKKIPLEEMDELFGGQNHVQKGAQLLGVSDAYHADISGSVDGEKNGHSTTHQETTETPV
ncbi:general substrate transporter [Xylariaceae sp. FL0255]|nr:general substrate transporter [Xylariaceae sp. FL0255]